MDIKLIAYHVVKKFNDFDKEVIEKILTDFTNEDDSHGEIPKDRTGQYQFVERIVDWIVEHYELNDTDRDAVEEIILLQIRQSNLSEGFCTDIDGNFIKLYVRSEDKIEIEVGMCSCNDSYTESQIMKFTDSDTAIKLLKGMIKKIESSRNYCNCIDCCDPSDS